MTRYSLAYFAFRQIGFEAAGSCPAALAVVLLLPLLVYNGLHTPKILE